ncbi:class F sortase [Candidatus Saccharibacteria bacterium]|nr:class F sortase [Candidatus Saccharibacteria bacterium]
MSRRNRISDFTRPNTYNRGTRRSFFIKADDDHQITKNRPKKQTKSLDIKRTPRNKVPVEPRQEKSKVLRRQGLKKLPIYKIEPKKKRLNARLIISSFAAVVIVLAVPALFYKLFFSQDNFVKFVKSSITGEKIPKYLISSSIMDVAAKVDSVDSIENDSTSLIDINHLGWYTGSSKPTEDGAMVFVGYVSGVDKTGALREIQSIQKDDYIQVETGNGMILLYKVVELKKYLPNQINEQDLIKPVIPGKQGLNIISFTDRLDTTSDFGTYRYVIYAVLE